MFTKDQGETYTLDLTNIAQREISMNFSEISSLNEAIWTLLLTYRIKDSLMV